MIVLMVLDGCTIADASITSEVISQHVIGVRFNAPLFANVVCNQPEATRPDIVMHIKALISSTFIAEGLTQNTYSK